MSKLIEISPTKTYATRENAVKAFDKKFSETGQRYFIMKTEDNRYFPVALGESAVQRGIHFHFNVVG